MLRKRQQQLNAILVIASVSVATFFIGTTAVHAAIPADYGLVEGDLISAAGSSDPDIYIVNKYGYKRLFLNPTIFTFYGHLKWGNVRTVSAATRDAFSTFGLFRNCETNDPKVYGVEVTAEDVGTLHWVNITGEQAIAQDAEFFKKVFCINSAEWSWYAKSSDYTALHQIPVYARISLPPPSSSSGTPSFEITVESGIRLQDASVPSVMKLSDGRYRMYYCGMRGIVSAISSDGLSFTKETGTRLAPTGSLGSDESVVCDPSVIQLSDGRFRMYYKGGTSGAGPGKSVQKIYSAISNDGLTFTREGLVIDSTQQDDGFASVPEAILLPDGRVRVYFVSDGAYVGHGIVSAAANDGLIFTRDTTKVVAFVDPSITTLPDGRYLLVAPTIPVLPGGVSAGVSPGIYALVSQDGVTFGSPITILVDGNIWIDPTVVKISTDTYRVYYWNPNEQPSQIHSFTMQLK